MHAVIISGGTIDDALVSRVVDEHSLVIAADRGVECCSRLQLRPDYIIGDFDSASPEMAKAVKNWGIPITKLPTHKDDTDTEAALALALLLDRENWSSLPEDKRYIIDAAGLPEGVGTFGIESVTILGCTGTRLDHVLGSISVIGQGLKARDGGGIPVYLMDTHNRVRMADPAHPIRIAREEMYGKYLSVVPFTTEAKGVTLKGVEYPLTDAAMGGFTSLGISNELAAGSSAAEISLTEGVLIVVEARD